MTGKVLRVLVVEDSLTVRRRLVEVLDADPGFAVVGEAGDGKRGIELALALRPDVITMDMMLPVMSGVAATEYIMAHAPTPILIVSSSTNRGELFKTYDALAAGAVDILEKPSGDEPEGEWEAKLVSTLRLVARIKVITHIRGRLRAGSSDVPVPPTSSPISTPVSRVTPRKAELIAVGASTGGPAALIDVFSALPPTFALPILVVLHIGEKFAGPLADWLHNQVQRPVSYATDGMMMSSLGGRIIMAPAERHLIVRGGQLLLTQDPPRFSCRPSVDVLFESVAHEYGASAIACLLTGMGRDGASGLLDVRRRGGTTIAQDEATSVIYGMPREAVLLGAAQHILPLPAIAGAITRLAENGQ